MLISGLSSAAYVEGSGAGVGGGSASAVAQSDHRAGVAYLAAVSRLPDTIDSASTVLLPLNSSAPRPARFDIAAWSRTFPESSDPPGARNRRPPCRSRDTSSDGHWWLEKAAVAAAEFTQMMCQLSAVSAGAACLKAISSRQGTVLIIPLKVAAAPPFSQRVNWGHVPWGCL